MDKVSMKRIASRIKKCKLCDHNGQLRIIVPYEKPAGKMAQLKDIATGKAKKRYKIIPCVKGHTNKLPEIGYDKIKQQQEFMGIEKLREARRKKRIRKKNKFILTGRKKIA